MLSLILVAGIAALLVVPLRAATGGVAAGGWFRERILILGATALAEQLTREIARRGSRSAVVGVLDDLRGPTSSFAGCSFLGPFSRLAEIVAELAPHRIVVAMAERRGRTPIRGLLECCVSRGILLEDGAEFYERLTGKLALDSLMPMTLLFSGRFRRSRLHEIFARGLSLLVSIAALAAMFPLLIVIPIAIKLDSEGPVFFIQDRIGMHGRPFKLMKFRTMQVGGLRTSEWAGDNRHRVTRVGRRLRAWRLDELPQFFNILRGDMDFVGPRPHPASNYELFTLVSRNLNEVTGTAIGCYTLRSLVRPGLTGWAQVRYRYANSLEEEMEKLRFDLYYIKHKSPALDMRILLETVKAIFLGRLEDGAREREPSPGMAA